jgi:hypothetical protein
MRRTLCHILTLAALIVPGTAVAEGSILPRPADCKAVMTIQKHGCEVETKLMCGSGKTAFWRSETYNLAGADGVSHSDQHYSLLEEQDADGQFRVVNNPMKSFADSPAEVIAKGTGNFLQIGTVTLFGIQKPVSASGTMTQEPDALQLSGRSLHRFSLDVAMKLPPPMPVINGSGIAYFDAPTGVLFEGEMNFDWPPSDGSIPSEPAALILPGQPGFDEPFPTYDCGDISLYSTDEKADRS